MAPETTLSKAAQLLWCLDARSMLRLGSLQQLSSALHQSVRAGTAPSPLPNSLNSVLRGFGDVASASAASTASPAASAHSLTHRFRDAARVYKQLSKARLSALVVSTACAGFVAASGERPDWGKLGWTALGTMGASSAANALNQVYEVRNDSLMKRTMRRPLPSGRIGRGHALAFAAVVGVSGVAILASKANPLTAALGAGNIVLYAGVYTPLKVLSISNTWVGAVVGAIPPLMGWTAATGQLDLGAVVMASTMYFWQMPHFMALAWMFREDYRRGGYRMLSCFDPSGRRTAACALRNCIYLMPVGALAAWLGVTSPPFAWESAIMTGGMTLAAAAFYSSPTNAAARTLFKASLLHLPVFMAALLYHRTPQTQENLLKLRASLENPLGSFAAMGVVDEQTLQNRDEQRLPRISAAPFPFLPMPAQDWQRVQHKADEGPS